MCSAEISQTDLPNCLQLHHAIVHNHCISLCAPLRTNYNKELYIIALLCTIQFQSNISCSLNFISNFKDS